MSRLALIATVAVGLTLGVVLGLLSDRLAVVVPANAMKVFDGDATEADRWMSQNFSAQDILDTRLLSTVGDTEVFAVRSAIDLSTQLRTVEPVICVVATSPSADFWFPAACVSESTFQQQGLRGVLIGNVMGARGAFSASYFRTHRLLTIVWHPSGALTVTDVTDDIVVDADDLYTDEEREAGLDIFIVSTLRFSSTDPEVEAYLSDFLPEAETGPAGIGGGSSGQGDTTESFLSVHPAVGPGEQRTVCLTGRVNGELYPPMCEPMDVFRMSGIWLTVPSSQGGILTLSVSSEGVGFDSSRNISE